MNYLRLLACEFNAALHKAESVGALILLLCSEMVPFGVMIITPTLYLLRPAPTL